MSHYFNLLDSKNVFAVINGENLLIDTGIPFSIYLNGTFNMGDKEYQLPEEAHGIGIEKLQEGFSEDVAGIIGMDILKQYNFSINRATNRIVFSDETLGGSGIPIEYSLFHGSYIMANIDIQGRLVKSIIDTGAKNSLTHPGFVSGFTPVIEGAKEFGLMPGWFYTDYYDIPVNLGEKTVALKFGLFPESMSGMMTGLMSMGIEVIFGIDIAHHFTVNFNLKSGSITLT